MATARPIQVLYILATLYTTLGGAIGSPISNPVPNGAISPQQAANVPQYRFQYYMRDERTGDYKTQDETRNGETVHGSYTVADPNGDMHTVTYTADVGNGFQAMINMQPAGLPFIKTQQQVYTTLPQHQQQQQQHHRPTKADDQPDQYPGVSYGVPMVKAQDYGSGTTISIPSTIIQSHTMQESSDSSNRAAVLLEVKLANVSDAASSEPRNSPLQQIFPTQPQENDYGNRITGLKSDRSTPSMYDEKSESHLPQATSSHEEVIPAARQTVSSNRSQSANEESFSSAAHAESTPHSDGVHWRSEGSQPKSMKPEESGRTGKNSPVNNEQRLQNKTRKEENNDESLRSLLTDPESLKAIGIDLETIEFAPGSLSMAEKLASSNSHLKLVQSAPVHTTHMISPSDVYGQLRNYPRSLSPLDTTASSEVPRHAYVPISPLTTVLVQDTFQAQLNTTPLKVHQASASSTRQAGSPQGKSLDPKEVGSVQFPQSGMIQQYYPYPMESLRQFPSQYAAIPYPMSQYPYMSQGVPISPSLAFVRTIVMPVGHRKDEHGK